MVFTEYLLVRMEVKMENKTNWWMILGIVIVVAIVTSLLTVNLTGNTIKLNQDRFGKYNVYTTDETDKRISDAITNVLDNIIADEVVEPLLELEANHTKEVLEMLNQRCEVVDGSESGITNPEEYSCQNICSKKRADLVCTFGIGTFKAYNSTIGDQKVVARSCQERTSPYNTYLSCMCCHSP